MDRHTTKRITSRISNWLWSAFVIGLLILGALWLLPGLMRWLDTMSSTL